MLPICLNNDKLDWASLTTFLDTSIEVFAQLYFECYQIAVEYSCEVTVKWLWQLSELLLDGDSFSLYLIPDMRQTRDKSLDPLIRNSTYEKSVPFANLFCQLLRECSH